MASNLLVSDASRTSSLSIFCHEGIHIMKQMPLASAFAKIKRAETHISDLNTAIGAFLETSPYKIVSEIDPDHPREVWRFVPDCIPDPIQNIAADALHNLRTPLDKMLTAYAEHVAPAPQKGKRHRGIGFPAGRRKDLFEDALARQEESLPDPVIKFLKSTEAYPGGKGHLLAALHEMDLDEKHHPILMPINLGTRKKQMGSVKTFGGFPLMFGSKRGAHMVPAPDAKPGAWHMVAPNDDVRPILRQDSSGRRYLEFAGPSDDMEFLTTTPGAQVEIDFQPTLNIAFRQIQGFESEPVVEVLKQLSEIVTGILVAFEKRFFS